MQKWWLNVYFYLTLKFWTWKFSFADSNETICKYLNNSENIEAILAPSKFINPNPTGRCIWKYFKFYFYLR